MAPKELNFITGNKNKLAEVQAILAPTGVDLKNQSVDLLEIQGTIEEISIDKCRRAADTVGKSFTFSINIQLNYDCLGWRTGPRRGYLSVLRCI